MSVDVKKHMPGRSREDIRWNAYGPDRGVVGITSAAPDITRMQRRPTDPKSVKKKADDSPPPSKYLVMGLVFFNVVMFGVHLVGAIWAISSDITKPTYITETRYNNVTLHTQTCAYEASNNCSNQTSNCEDPSLLDGIVDLKKVLVDDDMALKMENFEIRPFDFDGAGLTHAILVVIEILTALFHIIYAATFVRVLRELPDSTVFEWVRAQGGLPSRWIEYSFTSSIMSLFIANNANVFDVNALIAIALSTYATMYFGLLIEKNLASGHIDRALQTLYIPGMALFVVFVLPTLRQLWGDIAILSCKNPAENAFACEKTCFGNDVPIPTFIVVLVFLFAAFPLVTLQKIYYISGQASKWGGPPQELLYNFFCVQQTQGLTLPLFWIANGTVQFFLYATFVLLWGWMRALRRVVADIIWPALPIILLQEIPESPPPERLTFGILIGEYLYTTLSVVSKMFLLIFFITSFKDQNW